MIGYTERATRCSGSRSRIECSSTPAPSSGYMFWIAPIQMPIIPVRRSPKYFQVSESGPSGSADVPDVSVVVIADLLLPIGLTISVDTARCLRIRQVSAEPLSSGYPGVLRALGPDALVRRCPRGLAGG